MNNELEEICRKMYAEWASSTTKMCDFIAEFQAEQQSALAGHEKLKGEIEDLKDRLDKQKKQIAKKKQQRAALMKRLGSLRAEKSTPKSPNQAALLHAQTRYSVVRSILAADNPDSVKVRVHSKSKSRPDAVDWIVDEGLRMRFTRTELGWNVRFMDGNKTPGAELVTIGDSLEEVEAEQPSMLAFMGMLVKEADARLKKGEEEAEDVDSAE
ncbi:hypothetical protein J8273_3370 [Carpediemonas membranifera]|uniref:Uncharacterized protein n=1 Tax=Carpediemonas membranifera TaxID=201153 RepID=A0A8J6BAB4_9EUKA|nr:hypothetical protein J8273_3370 [Carpediemonas membranifera]|eukprot:KAG9393237.1 hypothetical protein J8273_3370 [Carpediemonas membranifera]